CRSWERGPQAWCTPIGLLAVIGPSRKLQRGPPAFCARSRANVRRSRHVSRSSCSWATRSGFEVTGRNMHLRCGRGSASRRRRTAGSVRQAPRTSPSILRAMQSPQEARPRARSPFVAAFLSLIFPGLGHLYAGAPQRALLFAAPPILLFALLGGVVIRLDQFELLCACLWMV